jgi:PPOX class probable F420-dependent enzyme
MLTQLAYPGEIVADAEPKLVPDLTIESLWSLLSEQHIGVLATIKQDGRPQLSNISYVYDAELRIARMLAASFRAKTRNLLRDPRASLHVSNHGFTLWLVAEGTVELSEPARSIDDAVGQEIVAMSESERVGMTEAERAEHIERYPVVDRQIIRMHIDRIYGGNASKALGVSST